MKIFISHASANKDYGNALVDLLRGIGLKEDEIIFTSNTAYGIPIGQNIFNWLKSQITEKPFVIYLLSKEYYQSIACLNEMGAAWVIENEHAVLFTPNFDLTSKEFLNGAIDPREIGFRINNEERLLSFIQKLDDHFTITKKAVLISQQVKKFLAEVDKVPTNAKEKVTEPKPTILQEIAIEHAVPKAQLSETAQVSTALKTVQRASSSPSSVYDKFLEDIMGGKLKDPELMLLLYITEMSRTRLMTGWQEDHEIAKLKEWEEVNEHNNLLSSSYTSVISRFEVRRYTEVSAVTGGGNAKEVKLKVEIEDHILYLPEDILDIINQAADRNKRKDREDEDEDLPF